MGWEPNIMQNMRCMNPHGGQGGYQPETSTLDPSTPPQGGSGVPRSGTEQSATPQRKKRFPAWLKDASASVRRDYGY
jgi:hypothetical protein